MDRLKGGEECVWMGERDEMRSYWCYGMDNERGGLAGRERKQVKM